MSAHKKNRIRLIYLLGTSFSGSTLVGYLIGSSSRVFNAGELMLFAKKKAIDDIPCFCGEPTRACNVWQRMNLGRFRLYDKPDLKTKLVLLLRLLAGRSLAVKFKKDRWADEAFCRRLLEQLPEGETIVLDTSKSLFRLMYLASTGGFDIKVVYIKRDLMGNVSSFVKNRDSILKGLFNYKLNHFFMPLFLKRAGLDYHFLSYQRLCRLPAKTLEALGCFLGLDLSYDKVIKRIKTRSYHVFTGSNTRVQFRDFKGIRYDSSWKTRLTPLQQRLIHMVATRSER